METMSFFKEATLRICGDLDIGNALLRLYEFVSAVVPLLRVTVEVYNPERQTMICMARIERGVLFRREEYEISDESAALIESVLASREPRLFHGEEHDDVVSDQLKARYSPRPTSTLAVILSVGGTTVGGISYQSERENVFTPEIVELLAQLNEPVGMALSNALRFDELTRIRTRLAEDNRFLRKELDRVSSDRIIGEDGGLSATMRHIRRVAAQDTPVLLLGETGVGKELFARATHALSPRRNGPFVPVNCGAIPPDLVDAELFGHERGAFTGAVAQHKGRFERAHGGTLFLDEVGELPLEAQVRLLRVLQEHCIERVGGTQAVAVDIRIIAATHRDLEEMLRRGDFREDLYFRLGVMPISVPPLRNRVQDIPPLAEYFIEKTARKMGLGPVRATPEGIARLQAYAWPGNVRELQNVIERAVLLCDGRPLTFHNLGAPRPRPAAPFARPEAAFPDLAEATAQHIAEALEIASGRVEGPGGAAQLLGLHPSTLRNKMRRLDVPFGRKARTTTTG
ncbi:MAG: sigma 54-interacting transcriptional regulator [Desulfovibrionaceae bacterium]|jgi:transcriptional regulator with GAF, ATPase, and Fis domain|nr:sigma 54-interacting transcriptional regulator [Desulfovibrionaceae bacterium]